MNFKNLLPLLFFFSFFPLRIPSLNIHDNYSMFWLFKKFLHWIFLFLSTCKFYSTRYITGQLFTKHTCYQTRVSTKGFILFNIVILTSRDKNRDSFLRAKEKKERKKDKTLKPGSNSTADYFHNQRRWFPFLSSTTESRNI